MKYIWLIFFLLLVWFSVLTFGGYINYTYEKGISEMENVSSNLDLEKNNSIKNLTESRRTKKEHEWKYKGKKYVYTHYYNKDVYEKLVSYRYQYQYEYIQKNDLFWMNYNSYFPNSKYYYINYKHILMEVYKNDEYIVSLSNAIKKFIEEENFDENESYNFIVSFVQSITYENDNVSTNFQDYARFPFETMIDGMGDCEDTSLLLGLLIEYVLGVDVILVEFPRHLMLGVWCNDCYGTYVELDEKKFFLLETTIENWELGDVPEKFQNMTTEDITEISV